MALVTNGKTPSFSPSCLEPFEVDDKDWRKTLISETPGSKRRLLSIRYSCHTGVERVEASLDDPSFLHRLLYAAEQVHLLLQDKLIVLIGYRYGACIRDILRLTIGDWRACGCKLEIRVHRGQGVGMLHLRPDMASLLRTYIHGECKEYDPEHRDILQIAETDPLFLTKEGCTYG